MSVEAVPAQPVGPASIEHEGAIVASNTGTADDIRSELQIEPVVAQPASDAKAEPEPKLSAAEQVDRIRDLTRRTAEQDREIKRLRDEQGRYAKAPAEKPVEPAAKAEPAKDYDGIDPADAKPRQDDFEDYEAFLDARDAWNERKIERKLAHRAQSQVRQQSEQQRHASFASRIKDAQAADPSLTDVLSASDVEIPERGPIPHVLMTSEVGVELMRYLAEHKDEADRLNHLDRTQHPMTVYGEIKKLEAKIELQRESRAEAAKSGSAAVVKPGTKAQPPINPVVSSHVAVKSDGPPGDDASDAEHDAYWSNPANRKKHGLK